MLEQRSPPGIDLVPAGYITLPELVRLLAQRLSDQDVSPDRPEIAALIAWIFGIPIPQDDIERPPLNQRSSRSGTAWLKHELSVRLIQQNISDGSLPILVIEPRWGLCRLLPEHLRTASLLDSIIRGGVIRALPGESLRRHEDRLVLLDRVVVDQWLVRKPWRSFQMPKRKECRKWLVSKMRAHPDSRPKEKNEFRSEAHRRFGVSWRQFDEIWFEAMTETGAKWRGRPRTRDADDVCFIPSRE
jgi:hypothetical protein